MFTVITQLSIKLFYLFVIILAKFAPRQISWKLKIKN